DEYRLPTAEERETLITRDATPPEIIPLLSTEQYGIDKFNDGWGRTALPLTLSASSSSRAL
ncbi:MAG: hypothetical protein ACOC8L_13210, partial [Spirochaetota bacterium]